MADVFISYSRRDSDFVRRIHDRLAETGRDVWVDWEDIPPTANWWQEICTAIEAADTFVFVISPDSVQSQVCRDEVQYAVDNNKRFVPLLYRELAEMGAGQIHPAIHTHNWIPYTAAIDFDKAFNTLLQAIDTDLSYVREHTRLLVRAREWQGKARDRSFLLTGVELADAKKWLDNNHGKHPEPTELQLNYILASQTAQTTRQRVFFVGLSVAFAIAIVLISVAFLLFRETQEARQQLVSQNATIDAQRTRVGQSSNNVVEAVNATLTAQAQQNVVQSTVSGFQRTAVAAQGRANAAEATLTQVSGELAQVVSENATLVARVGTSNGGVDVAVVATPTVDSMGGGTTNNIQPTVSDESLDTVEPVETEEPIDGTLVPTQAITTDVDAPYLTATAIIANATDLAATDATVPSPTPTALSVGDVQQTATSLAATINAITPTDTFTPRPTRTPIPSATPLPDLFPAPTLVHLPPATGGGSLSNFYVSPAGNDSTCARNGGTSSCATIGHALALSEPGDVIALEEGVYTETLVLHHNVTLIGYGDPSLTLINGNGMGATIVVDGDVTAQISFVTITGGVSDHDGGGILNDGTLRLFGVTIFGNTSATVGGGIANYGNLVVQNSSIESNYAAVGGGIYNGEDALMILDDTTSTVVSNSASSGRGDNVYEAATGISSQSDVCPALVQRALQTVGNVCDGLGHNEACYGAGVIEAEDFDAELLPFNQPGDRVSFANTEAIYLERAAPGAPNWSVVMLNVQASIPGALPGQGLTIVVYSIDAEYPDLAAGVQAIVNTEGDTLNVRSGPGLDNRVITELRDGTLVTIIDGPVEADGFDWWQIELEDGRQGWSVSFVEDEFGAIDTLVTTIDLTEVDQQAFILRTGIGSTACTPVPTNGLLLQGPEPMRLTIDINAIYIEEE